MIGSRDRYYVVLIGDAFHVGQKDAASGRLHIIQYAIPPSRSRVWNDSDAVWQIELDLLIPAADVDG